MSMDSDYTTCGPEAMKTFLAHSGAKERGKAYLEIPTARAIHNLLLAQLKYLSR